MQPKNVAIRKRTQIAIANRTMFFWVAGVSVLFGFAAVATIFLSQMLMFNEKVLSEKGKTIQILKNNNNNVKELELEIKALDTNQALQDSRADSNDQALQVILDALPSDANIEALGASIKDRLLAGIDNLIINSVDIDTTSGGSNKPVVNASPSTASSNEMGFRFSVTGDEAALKKVLDKLEKSVRTIDVTSLKIDAQDEGIGIMNIQGRAFYEPVREVQLRDKTVRQ